MQLCPGFYQPSLARGQRSRDQFHRLNPGEPATEATEVRVLYDAQFLYVSAVLHGAHVADIVVKRRATAMARASSM